MSRHNCDCSFKGCGDKRVRNVPWNTEICEVISQALPLKYPGGLKDAVSVFTKGGAGNTRDNRVFRESPMTACHIPGRGKALKLYKSLFDRGIETGERSVQALTLNWTQKQIQLWVQDGVIPEHSAEAIMRGLNAAKFLNKYNKNKSWKDGVHLLLYGRFHRAHFLGQNSIFKKTKFISTNVPIMSSKYTAPPI